MGLFIMTPFKSNLGSLFHKFMCTNFTFQDFRRIFERKYEVGLTGSGQHLSQITKVNDEASKMTLVYLLCI